MNGRMGEWINAQTDNFGWVGGWADGRTDEWMGG